jgi:hypothetical protein
LGCTCPACPPWILKYLYFYVNVESLPPPPPSPAAPVLCLPPCASPLPGRRPAGAPGRLPGSFCRRSGCAAAGVGGPWGNCWAHALQAWRGPSLLGAGQTRSVGVVGVAHEIPAIAGRSTSVTHIPSTPPPFPPSRRMPALRHQPRWHGSRAVSGRAATCGGDRPRRVACAPPIRGRAAAARERRAWAPPGMTVQRAHRRAPVAPLPSCLAQHVARSAFRFVSQSSRALANFANCQLCSLSMPCRPHRSLPAATIAPSTAPLISSSVHSSSRLPARHHHLAIQQTVHACPRPLYPLLPAVFTAATAILNPVCNTFFLPARHRSATPLSTAVPSPGLPPFPLPLPSARVEPALLPPLSADACAFPLLTCCSSHPFHLLCLPFCTTVRHNARTARALGNSSLRARWPRCHGERAPPWGVGRPPQVLLCTACGSKAATNTAPVPEEPPDFRPAALLAGA